jgi:hypothetical protein
MAYYISKETIECTNCVNNFHCLEGDLDNGCEALDAESNPVVVTICRKRKSKCDYCKHIDDQQGICTCPTRIELYVRYGF